MTQFLQNVQGYTAFDAGLRTLPASVGIFAVAPLAGLLTSRLGPRLPIVLGSLLAATSLFVTATTLEPDTSYATLWWQVALFGVGSGFMLTPLTAAVLAATPAQRSGLGSSILNTCRTVGITLGVAVLGAFVLQQFPSNLASQLTEAGVPSRLAATIANRISAAGAGAGQAPQPGHMLLSLVVLHKAVNQAFVDTLHGTFLIVAIGLLAVAVLVAFLLQQKQPVPKTSVTSASLSRATEALGVVREQVTG
jgi:DHA2 family methylenomycin A resistance protein-like MFS transporter